MKRRREQPPSSTSSSSPSLPQLSTLVSETEPAHPLDQPNATTSADNMSPFSPISPWPPPLPADAQFMTSSTVSNGTQQSLAIMQEDPLPSPKEIYGSIAIVLTSIAYVLYFIWGVSPPEILDGMGWTWYPDQ
jgi:hypothetical protein